VALGIQRGARIVRVHDVGYMTKVARMTDAIVKAGER
jgi:dihydropteroate synthase